MTHPKAPGVALSITEAMIRQLVDAFYTKVRADAVLGPVFEAKIDNWDQHLAKLTDFWSSIVLMSGRYKGRPTAVCPPQAADLFNDRARRIAQSLKAGIALARGDCAAAL